MRVFGIFVLVACVIMAGLVVADMRKESAQKSVEQQPVQQDAIPDDKEIPLVQHLDTGDPLVKIWFDRPVGPCSIRDSNEWPTKAVWQVEIKQGVKLYVSVPNGWRDKLVVSHFKKNGELRLKKVFYGRIRTSPDAEWKTGLIMQGNGITLYGNECHIECPPDLVEISLEAP